MSLIHSNSHYLLRYLRVSNQLLSGYGANRGEGEGITGIFLI